MAWTFVKRYVSQDDVRIWAWYVHFVEGFELAVCHIQPERVDAVGAWGALLYMVTLRSNCFRLARERNAEGRKRK